MLTNMIGRYSCLLLILLCSGGISDAFLSPTAVKTCSYTHSVGWSTRCRRSINVMAPLISTTPRHRLQLFRKDDAPKSEESSNENKSKSTGGGFLDFLSGFGKPKDEEKTTAVAAVNTKEESKVAALVTVVTAQVDDDEEAEAESTTPSLESSSSSSSSSSPATTTIIMEEGTNHKELDAVERSRQLKSQAERLRLEAERMDAELTLEKIARLERELAAAQRAKERRHVDVDVDDNQNGVSHDASRSSSSRSNANSDAKVEEIQREMEVLRAKIRGEKPPPPPVRKPATAATKSFRSSSMTSLSPSKRSITVSTPGVTVKVEPSNNKLPVPGPFSQENFDRLCKELNDSPDIVKKVMASIVEMDYEDASKINVTELALRVEQMERMDLSFSKRPMPEFTDEDIARAKEDIGFNSWYKEVLSMLEQDPEHREYIKSNETELALRALTYEYFMEDKEIEFAKLAEGEDWLQDVIEAINRTTVDRTIESIFPKCMRKEGAVELTMAQVQLLTTEVLPKASFVVSERPEPVLGGYIVRGSSRLEDGDELMEAIEREMSKSPALKDKMNVFYLQDFSFLANVLSDMDNMAALNMDPDEAPPILYVTPRDVAREPKRVSLTIVSALGVATSWYLSVYPFLLNNGIMQRVDEQINLADSNMAYDLSWLTDLSLPLFITFMGIQFSHEIGHRLAAGVYNTSLSIPTFVPSLMTGMTSTVTSFKEPPKNRNAMFDISIAGPLTGLLASLLALVLGSQLTLVNDPSLFPALPLELLRQSSLGGGIINAVLGNNVLGLPGGVTAAGMTVVLHPVAIAGFFGLFVNALSLLPVGTTDGGRIAVAILGRPPKLLVGSISLVLLLLAGFLRSELFLFYAAFVLGCQTGNEIPARNEYDDLSFSRTLVGIASLVVAILALVPFQN